MPYIPHDAAETASMLATIGVESLDALFDEIPETIQSAALSGPAGISEAVLRRELEDRAEAQPRLRCFAGGGAYAHHIPALVWEIASRGEFYSAYTPYQPEASQGTLQLLYEFQSFMTRLTGMEVSNASLYDGASALAEACLMALRLRPERRAILVPETLWPHWRRVLDSLLGLQGIPLIALPADPQSGCTAVPSALAPEILASAAAIILPQINARGLLEDVEALSLWAESHGLLRIAVCNPLSLSLLRPPGEWGETGADIAVGEGQPLGVPLSGGGPYFGFLTTRKAHVRQLPGRLVARTVDGEGKTGYCLTLQAREQHIRRGQATSNICTNQGLLVTAATLHMATLGAAGLLEAAATSHSRAVALRERLAEIPGVDVPWTGPIFNEFVIRLPVPAAPLRDSLLARGFLAGIPLSDWGLDAPRDLLLATTELLTPEDLDDLVVALAAVSEEGV